MIKKNELLTSMTSMNNNIFENIIKEYKFKIVTRRNKLYFDNEYLPDVTFTTNENIFWLGDIMFFERHVEYLRFILDYYISVSDKRNDPYLNELFRVIDTSEYALKTMFKRSKKINDILV